MDPRMMDSLMMGPGGTMGHWGMGGAYGRNNGTLGTYGPMPGSPLPKVATDTF